jgi:hypothetical protein
MRGTLAYSCNMFSNIPLTVDWQTIAQHCEQYVNDNLYSANRKQCQYDYALGWQGLKKLHNLTNLGVRTTDPCTVEQAHVNGMLTIELHPGLIVCINIHSIIPYQ